MKELAFHLGLFFLVLEHDEVGRQHVCWCSVALSASFWLVLCPRLTRGHDVVRACARLTPAAAVHVVAPLCVVWVLPFAYTSRQASILALPRVRASRVVWECSQTRRRSEQGEIDC